MTDAPMRTLTPAETAAALASFALEGPDRSPWPIPDEIRERIEHAQRIAADTRAMRDTNPVGIVHYRPLHVRWPA